MPTVRDKDGIVVRPFAVERWFAEYEFKVRYNIAESCIKPLTIPEILTLTGMDATTLLGTEPLGYVDAAGSPELRAEIASLYPNTTADEVLVTCGAIEANYLLYSSLIEPGSTVICQFPAYQQLYEIARSRGADVRFWHLRRENGYKPDLDDLRSLAYGPVKMIVINNPHNPTGALLDEHEMRSLVGIAHSCGAILHSDEVYNGISYGRMAPTARALSARCVVTGSMSKVYGLAGARLGWIAGPREAIDACARLRDYTSICPPMLSEKLSTALLRSRAAVLRRSREIAFTNLSLVRDWMQQNEGLVSWVEPEGGVVCFPWFSPALRSVPDSEAICRRLAYEQSVLLVPGSCFEQPAHFRLGFGYSTERLAEGLARVASFLKSV